ncbi:hypothetical protein [Microvirga sp. G4-2]|uniref:hypothetical protein n=1 Tax=Microvirga sp. G4-2 TaxID=3434467 RepID=UPI0040448E6B
MNAILREPATGLGQEGCPERHAIRRQVEIDFALEVAPDGKRRPQQGGVDSVMVLSGNLNREPDLKLAQRKMARPSAS